jgi:hypothetical protein
VSTATGRTDVADFVEYADRFRAAIKGGVVAPVFSADGRFVFEEQGLAWQVDPGTGAKVQAAPEPDRTAAGRLLHERARPRRIQAGFLAGDADPLEVPSPDGTLMLGEVGPNLALRAVVDDRPRPLTGDGSDGNAWAVDGAQSSPDSQRLAVIRIDTSACHRMPRSRTGCRASCC